MIEYFVEHFEEIALLLIAVVAAICIPYSLYLDEKRDKEIRKQQYRMEALQEERESYCGQCPEKPCNVRGHMLVCIGGKWQRVDK